MSNGYAETWRQALLLPGETDLVESGIRELAEYFNLDRETVRRACESALQDSKREWESAERRTPRQIVDFYRHTHSYLFEHIWWHATDVETNATNAVLLEYARKRGVANYLDFGSGVGSNGILFARHGIRVTLADVSQTMLEFARWRFERRGIGIELIDLNQQSLPREKYDFVTAVDVCEHLANPGAEFGQISRAMKPGGVLVFNYRAGLDEDRPMHILATAAPVLRAIRRNGFCETAPDATHLQALEFSAVERKDRNRIEEAVFALIDRARYCPLFMAAQMNGTQMNGTGSDGRQIRHPQRVFFDRVEDALQKADCARGPAWLDAGCGRELIQPWMKGGAELESRLRSAAKPLVGIDLDFSALRQNNACDLRLNADVARLPFADDQFDLVTANMAFEYFADPRETMLEIRRVLRPGGAFLALTTNWLDITAIGSQSMPGMVQRTLHRHNKKGRFANHSNRYFRLNRPGKIARVLATSGFRRWKIEAIDQPGAYAEVPVLARIESTWARIAQEWPALRGILLIEAE